MEKAISKFQKTGVKIRALKLEGGKDPDEIIKKFGPERFKSLIDGAANEIEYKLLEKRAQYDIETSDGKLNFLKDATVILAGLNGPIEKDIYASRLSQELNVSKEAVLLQVEQIQKRQQKKAQKVSFSQLKNEIIQTKDAVNPQRPDNLKAAKAEELLISSLINNPDFLKKIDGKVSNDDFVTEFNRRVFEKISERISNGLPIDAMFLSSDFSPQEMSRIVKLGLKSQKVSNTITECEDCIKVLKQEKNSIKDVNPSQLSDDEFLKLFNINT